MGSKRGSPVPGFLDPLGLFGSDPKPPTPPDPVVTANAQAAANRETAIAEAQLNRVNQVTPYGTTQFSQTPGPGGVPIYTQTTTESPNQQALREGQENLGIDLSAVGQRQIGQLSDALSAPYDPRRINLGDTTGGQLDLAQVLGGNFDLSQFDPTRALGDYGQQVEQDTYNLATRRLGGEFDRAEEGLRTRLANQGITPGSEAFENELESFNRSRGDAYASAQLGARDTAERSRAARTAELLAGAGLTGDERTQRINEILTGRTQNLEEALQQYGIDTTADISGRTQPLQEIQAIMHGTPLTPINPGAIATSGINPTDIAGITQTNYQQLLNAFNAQQQQQQSTQGAVAGVAGAALVAF